MSRSALLIVTESRSGKANSHSISRVDDAQDRGLPARRRDLEMNVENGAKFVWRRQARKRSFAIHGGTPRITESSAPSSCCVRSKSSATARSPQNGRPEGVRRTERADPRAARKASAGSMKLLRGRGRRTAGGRPFPQPRESRATEPRSSAAELSGGSVLSAEVSSGRQSRS